MPADHFGEQVAAVYDERYAEVAGAEVVEPIVDLLAVLADGGSALELGIGTGRVALPLAERGVPVHGIELSDAMVARLRAKPGGDAIPVTIGDFAMARAGDGFAVAYLAANTIMNLTTQEEQVACFRNVAPQLTPGGCFVVDVVVPALQRLPPGETFQPFDVGPRHVGIDEVDVVSQALVSHHWWFRDGAVEQWSAPFRYVWPAELDLMARLAGMTLHERRGGWRDEPVTAASRRHVSIWEVPR